MNSSRMLRLFVALALFAPAPAVFGCTSPQGYFYQVARLRGTVVGVDRSDWRHSFRWFRQHATAGAVKLSLYQYRWPLAPGETRPLVKTVRANKYGVFDFKMVPKGHYALSIENPWAAETWFDVEVVWPAPANAATDVMLDISPVKPDCTGGPAIVPVGR